MFPIDKDDPVPPLDPMVRGCPDCKVEMRVGWQGGFTVLYVCPRCGVSMTVPHPHAPAGLK